MGDSSTSSTSSISQGTFKTTKPSHFRAKINFQNIQIEVRKLHRNTINLSVKKNLKKKQTKNTQRKCIKILYISLFFYVVLLGFTVTVASLLYVVLLSYTSFF
ncbi:hypothetical protein AHAS_Ahas04G0050600 [Arachis hypogaea]